MNATTVSPTSAPITSVSTRNTCSSRFRKNPSHSREGTFHQGNGGSAAATVPAVPAGTAVPEVIDSLMLCSSHFY